VTTLLWAVPAPVCNTSSSTRRPRPRAAATRSHGATYAGAELGDRHTPEGARCAR
jgi:hypothetical protein